MAAVPAFSSSTLTSTISGIADSSDGRLEQGRAPQNEFQQALTTCRSCFVAVGIFSLFINPLMLTPAFYMLQVCDREVSSGSESTLVMLSLIILLILLSLGGLEWVRSQILVRVAARLETGLDQRLLDAAFRQALYSGGSHNSGQAQRNAEAVEAMGMLADIRRRWRSRHRHILDL